MRINLFGGPGVGKSIKAAEIYVDGGCELVQEFVKPRAFRGELVKGWECVTTFGCQLKREIELLPYTDIVTDSPLLLQAIYALFNDCPVAAELVDMAMKFDEDHPCDNFLVERVIPYTSLGRFQNEEEAIEIDKKIKTVLDELEIKYVKI